MTGAHRAAEPERSPEAKRSPEEIRADIGALRQELGGTVEELVHRVDVPTRVKEKREETVERVRQQVGQAQELVREKAPVVTSAVRENAVAVGGGVLLVLILVIRAVRRRSRD